MSGPVFSASWYRVAELTPRLRSHARIHRHQYRGETWYVLQDLASDRVHRFSPAGYVIIGLMDGHRTVQHVWDIATERLGDDCPSQDEIIHLLSQLQMADVLQCEVTPDTAELLRRYEQRQRRTFWSRWASPLSWRFSLFDPERVLRLGAPIVRPLFGVTGFLIWLAVVGAAVVAGAVHWHDLTSDILDRVLMPQNAIVLWLMFPLVKTIHEFGHAFATKIFGGEVHDMGVMFLVFTPIPYVDASSASAFRSKWQRLVVGAAGMGVELFVAAWAVFFWLSAQPGLGRTIAYNVILIAGVSTVAFNANPLLRYDGYYMLADFLEIPNLYSRAQAWIGYVVERYVFGVQKTDPPLASPGERVWFTAFSILSTLYRAFVIVAIAFFVIQRMFYIGLVIVLLGFVTWGIMPLSKGITYLASSPRLRGQRVRAVSIVAAVVVLLVVGLGFTPVPFRTRAEGVVWIPDEAFVRVQTEGFVDHVVARFGAHVQRGDVLIVCRDPVLATQAEMLTARVRELQARYDSERTSDLVKMLVVLEELKAARQELDRIRERLRNLTITAGVDGTFVVPSVADLPGRFVKKGELLGHVVDLDRVTVRTIVNQSAIDLVQHRTRAVQVRLSERLTEPLPASLVREVPGATERLPSPALGHEGGGKVATDPRDPQGTKAMEKLFQVDLEIVSPLHLVNVGGRVYVRFDHGWAPLGTQWYLHVRQLFLSRFNV